MSLIDNGIGNFSGDIRGIFKDLEDIFEGKSEKPSNSQKKPSLSIPLSKDEKKAFVGLCSLEGKPVKEKIAELIKDYIEEKRKQMRK